MNCSSGACTSAFSAGSSLPQGQTFASLTSKFHGGKRRNTRRMRGGSHELAAYPTAFDYSTELHQQAGTAGLDKAIAELGQFKHVGGSRKRRTQRKRTHKKRGGNFLTNLFAPKKPITSEPPVAPPTNETKWYTTPIGMSGGVADISESSMILSPQEESQAFLHPQWRDENLVNPHFIAPNAKVGGSRKSRKGSRKSRKGNRKSYKGKRKGSRKVSRKVSRKGNRKSRKQNGGKKSRKGSRKTSKKSRKSRKGCRK